MSRARSKEPDLTVRGYTIRQIIDEVCDSEGLAQYKLTTEDRDYIAAVVFWRITEARKAVKAKP